MQHVIVVIRSVQGAQLRKKTTENLKPEYISQKKRDNRVVCIVVVHLKETDHQVSPYMHYSSHSRKEITLCPVLYLFFPLPMFPFPNMQHLLHADYHRVGCTPLSVTA